MIAGTVFKLVIVVMFVLILLSLASGLFFLGQDKGRSTRTAYSLTIRVVLSIGVFVLLLIGFATGWIQPHGLYPQQPASANSAADTDAPSQTQNTLN